MQGGTEEAFFPLLPYLFDNDTAPAALFTEKPFFYNYTDFNSKALKKEYLSLMADCEEETLELVTELLADLKTKQGKGLIRETDDPSDDWLAPLPSANYQGQVFLLTDSFCAGPAEHIVRACKASSRVTVIGRETAGDTGWYYPTRQPLSDSITLEYPAAVSEALLQEKRLQEHPAKPDFFIPWPASEPESAAGWLETYLASASAATHS